MGVESENSASVAAPLKVVHIFSPRVFRTDAQNFRSLVQCLTGNKRHLYDDPSWIPLGCVELTPRKRLSPAGSPASIFDFNPNAASSSGATGGDHQHQQLHHQAREVEDFVSGLIAADGPLPDLLPPFPPASVAGYDHQLFRFVS